MSRLNSAKGLGESLRSRIVCTHFLAFACSCAQRVQASLEGLGAASNVLLLTGVGTSLVVSYLSRLTVNGGLRPASREVSSGSSFGLADSLLVGADLP